jgi:hypothetical protein
LKLQPKFDKKILAGAINRIYIPTIKAGNINQRYAFLSLQIHKMVKGRKTTLNDTKKRSIRKKSLDTSALGAFR